MNTIAPVPDTLLKPTWKQPNSSSTPASAELNGSSSARILHFNTGFTNAENKSHIIVGTINFLFVVKSNTVEPLNSRHHWDRLICLLYGGVLCQEVPCI